MKFFKKTYPTTRAAGLAVTMRLGGKRLQRSIARPTFGFGFGVTNFVILLITRLKANQG